jgi:hypothetical protein
MGHGSEDSKFASLDIVPGRRILGKQ